MSFKEYSKDIGLDEKIANKLIDAVSNEKALSFEDIFGDLMESLINIPDLEIEITPEIEKDIIESVRHGKDLRQVAANYGLAEGEVTKILQKKSYRSRPTKGNRRTKEDITSLKNALYSILSQDHPQTVRGVFYQAVSKGTIAKTETQYKNVVVRLLAEMRKNGDLPFEWLADSTRWMRKPRTYSNLEAAMKDAWECYRKSVWHDQPVYIEIWMEKEALAGVIYEETALWDVPLMVTRGYPSLSFLHTAGEAIKSLGKSTYVYYLGDHDPSGVDISKKVESGLREYASDVEIYFERVAVTLQQIQDWSLPTRPTKISDTRSKNFKGDSVELDSIPAKQLRQLIGECITQHIDQETIERLEMAEQAEKETLKNIILDTFYTPERR